MSCALALHTINPAYVWRRIRGVALEEFSVADLELVAQVLSIAGKRALQRKLGERALLVWMTTRLAKAPKCRTACDLLMWLPPTSTSSSGTPSVDVAAKSNAGDYTTLLQSASLWKSIMPNSVRTVSGWVSVSRGDSAKRDAWLEAVQMPPMVDYVVRRGGCTDTLNVLLVPVYQLAQGGARLIRSATPSPTSLEEIGGLPAYAYCLFSQQGRSALRHFLATQEPWRRRFSDLGVRDSLRALGHLVFEVGGGFCAETLTFPQAEEIKALSEIATLARFGIAATDVQHLQREMSNALQSLNLARRSVAGETD